MKLLIAAFDGNDDREHDAVVIDFTPAFELKLANYRRAVADFEDEFPEFAQVELWCPPILLPKMEEGVWLDAPENVAPLAKVLEEAGQEEPPLETALYSAVLVSKRGCYFTFNANSELYGSVDYETQFIDFEHLEGLKHAEPLSERS